MINKLLNLFKSEKLELIHNGYGSTELPFSIYQNKQPIKSSDFKLIVNGIFLPEIYKLGFRGKDFLFYRENELYTEVVYFWIHKSGKAIQVDLLVKFNNIKYPNEKSIKPKDIRPLNAEFQKRLSANGELNQQGQEIWFWIFDNQLEENEKIVMDIWRVFSRRGVPYFEKFKNHKDYISKITIKNYLNVREFHLTINFGRFETGVLYFLSEYWNSMNDKSRAEEFAKLGIQKCKKDDIQYLTKFNEIIKLTK